MDVFAADEATLVPGRLRVFRCWRLDGSRLLSTGHEFVWHHRQLTAGCLRYDPGWDPDTPILTSEHPAPTVDCTCGIYGWYQPNDCRVVLGPVFGCIEVWGRVVMGSNGVRAEQARIVALAVNGQAIDGVAGEVNRAIDRVTQYAVGTVGQRLGVPVFATPAELVAAHPPEDLSALGVKPVKIRSRPHRVYVVAGSVAATAGKSVNRRRNRRIRRAIKTVVLAGILATFAIMVTALINQDWGGAAIDAGLIALNLQVWGQVLFRR